MRDLAFTNGDGVLVAIDVSEGGWAARATHLALGPEGNQCVVYVGEGADAIPTANGLVPGRSSRVRCQEESAAARLDRLPGGLSAFLLSYYRELGRHFL